MQDQSTLNLFLTWVAARLWIDILIVGGLISPYILLAFKFLSILTTSSAWSDDVFFFYVPLSLFIASICFYLVVSIVGILIGHPEPGGIAAWALRLCVVLGFICPIASPLSSTLLIGLHPRFLLSILGLGAACLFEFQALR
jgi:hypothetical protein